MPKYFTRLQAESLLPEVEQSIRQAIELKKQYEGAEKELQSVSQRIMMLGGSQVNREHLLALRGRRESTAAGLKDAIEEIHRFGCHVKDLDIGLIDFPTLYKGEAVYLCWKLGEPRIDFWHGIEEGFRGRKPIDDEFLANHQGDLTH
jgi:hypothetical protein